jgi:hypothetical protein
MRITFLTNSAKKRKINRLIAEIEGLEHLMRDHLAALVELTEHGDDLHVEALRVLEALDG